MFLSGWEALIKIYKIVRFKEIIQKIINRPSFSSQLQPNKKMCKLLRLDASNDSN